MNTVTKLLVVLVVVLSLVQTAATVVFVNRVNLTAKTNEELDKTNQTITAQIAQLRAQNATAQAEVTAVRNAAQAAIAAANKTAESLQQTLRDRDHDKTELTAQASRQAIEAARLSEALKASEDTKSKFADQLAELRKFNDDLSKRVGDLNVANADLTNRLEVTERERRFLQEQNQELQNQAARATAAMKDAGVSAPAATAAVGVGRGAPAINAVVEDVRPIANIPYATISVGSADRVVKGMQFTVLDSQGNFLGFLVVETVEPNQAAGRLSGPRVTDIKKGNDARTQL